MLLGHRRIARGAIYLRAGHVHKPLDPCFARSRKQIQRGSGVDLVVFPGRMDRMANAEAGQMKDSLHSLHQFQHACRVPNILYDQLELLW